MNKSLNLLKKYVFKIIIFSLVFVLCPINSSGDEKPEAKSSVEKSVESKDGKKSYDENKKGDVSEEFSLDDSDKPVIGDVEEESYAWLVVKTFIVLGALIGGFYYFFRFVTKKTGITTIGEDVVKILSIVPVGQNRFLQIVDIAGRVLVLGVTDTNINLITEISNRDEIDRIRLLSSKSVKIHPDGFQQYLSKYINRYFNKGQNRTGENFGDLEKTKPSETGSDKMDFLKMHKDRLKNLNGDDDEI